MTDEEIKKLLKDEKEFISKIMEEEKELKKDYILSIDSSWGMGIKGPGSKDMFVTKNKKIYECYILLRFNYKDSYIKKVKDLSDEEYKRITDFVENEIKDKDYEDELMLDASFYVEINYDGTNKTVKNDMELYQKVRSFLEEIINK